MILGHIFPHPFPEPLNGVEVRTVPWQGKEGEPQSSRGVLNEFGFVARRPIAGQGKGRLELLDVGNSFCSVSFLENLLAFLPTQPMLFQHFTQGAAADFTVEDLLDPIAQLLDAPIVSRKAMLYRFAFFYGCCDLGNLFLGKKGGRPPVRR